MERDAFEAAAERSTGRVLTYAAYLLGDRGEAEDVTQDVLIKLWQHGDRVDPERLGVWLLTVTRNACTDVLRRRRRIAEVIPIRRGDDRPPDGPSDRPGPERLAAGSQLGDRIVEALDALSEPARSVVVLREIQGCSYAEIAEIMAISLDSVKVTLHRARRRLRDILKEVHPHVAAG